MAKKKTKTQKILASVGRELRKSPPTVLAKTAAKKGSAAAERQRVAILLEKARARGAHIPRKKK